MSVSNKFQFNDEMIQRNFERVLNRALKEGIPAPSETGLDYEVEKAIVDVALAFPNGEQYVAKARKAFEDQMARNA
jgi:hypothetical protein